MAEPLPAPVPVATAAGAAAPAARRWWPWLVAMAVGAATAGLGFWQLDRAAQKLALQSAQQARGAEPPLLADDLARDPAAAPSQLHRRAIVQGRWLAASTVYLENRPMAGRVGFYAVTPLQLDDGSALLVQRGWLPRDLMDRERIVAAPPPSGRVTLVGRLALTPSRLYEFDAAASGPIRQNLDLAAFAAETGLRLRPLVLVQESDVATAAAGAGGGAAAAADDGLRRDWPAPASGVAKHHGYAFQWFGLSALSLALVLWFEVLRPRRWGGGAAPAGAGEGAGEGPAVDPDRGAAPAPTDAVGTRPDVGAPSDLPAPPAADDRAASPLPPTPSPPP